MAHIVCGSFDRTIDADAAIAALRAAGYADSHVDAFSVSPPALAKVRSGRMIAVREESAEKEREVAQLMRRHNARSVGRADGEWHEGQWRDFDPRKPLEAL